MIRTGCQRPDWAHETVGGFHNRWAGLRAAAVWALGGGAEPVADHAERQRRGSLEVISGCMFSGKTERLLARIANARSRAVEVAVFKHASDYRYGRRRLATHSGKLIEAVAVSDASSLMDEARGAQLVVIDEGQFFDGQLVDVCRELVARGCDVVVAGLDLDSWGLPFGPMPALEAAADHIIRTRAVCAMCGEVAEYTQRTAPIESDDMIGGAEAYEPRCARCFTCPENPLRR